MFLVRFALTALFVVLANCTSRAATTGDSRMMNDPIVGGLGFGIGAVDEGLGLAPRTSLDLGETIAIFPSSSIPKLGVAFGVNFGFIPDSFVRPTNTTGFRAYGFEQYEGFSISSDSEKRRYELSSGPWATVHANAGIAARAMTFGRTMLWSIGISGMTVQPTTHVTQARDGSYWWRQMQYPWAGEFLLPGLYAQASTELFWGLTSVTVSATKSIRWEERLMIVDKGILIPTETYEEHSSRQWRLMISVFPWRARALN